MRVMNSTLSAFLLLLAANAAAAPDLPAYSVTDLKALGIWPVVMNQKGEVVGLACCGRQSAGVQFYTSAGVRDLGLPAGGFASFTPVAVNDSGWIAGNARKPSLPGPDNEQYSDAALYDGGGWTIIDTSALGHPTHVSGLNNAGQVIGNSAQWPALLTLKPWLYENGRLVQLTQAPNSAASDISEVGEVVGYSGPTWSPGLMWSYRDGQLQELKFSGVPRVNDSGDILATTPSYAGVGSSAYVLSGGTQLPFSTAGCYVPSPYAGRRDYYAVALNERSEVAGYGVFACLFSSGTSVGLGTLGGDRSAAQSLNNRGQVAGWSLDSQGRVRPFVYGDGVMVDVADLRGVGAALQLGNPNAVRVDINDGPYLLVTATNTLAEPDTLEAAYLLTPIAPTLTLAATPTEAPVRQAVRLTWTSESTNGCVAGGGTPGDGWSGDRPTSGQFTVTSNVVGEARYAMRCSAGPLAAESQVLVRYAAAPPAVRLSATPAESRVRQNVTLGWATEGADGCAATGGRSGDGWQGALATSGQQQVTNGTVGVVEYGIRCASGELSSEARVSVTYTKRSSGGGHVDPAFLLLGLSALGFGRRRRAI